MASILISFSFSWVTRKQRQLSGGQCQRVGLARALDVTTQAQILELLTRLQRERALTLLYISHDLSVVSSICQRVYIFKAGRIVENGPARQVPTTPKYPCTQEHVGSLSHLAPAASLPIPFQV
jgi:peptide/nickel transport system ATP-binding protein